MWALSLYSHCTSCYVYHSIINLNWTPSFTPPFTQWDLSQQTANSRSAGRNPALIGLWALAHPICNCWRKAGKEGEKKGWRKDRLKQSFGLRSQDSLIQQICIESLLCPRHNSGSWRCSKVAEGGWSQKSNPSSHNVVEGLDLKQALQCVRRKKWCGELWSSESGQGSYRRGLPWKTNYLASHSMLHHQSLLFLFPFL